MDFFDRNIHAALCLDINGFRSDEMRNNKTNWWLCGLYFIFALTLIQTIKETFALGLMKKIGVAVVGKEVFLAMIMNYYLVLICLILTIGFIALIKSINRRKSERNVVA